MRRTKSAVKGDGGFDFDVVVVGGGSAGYAAARSTAAAGLKTAVADGARELGGLCILRGCMPTKALLHAAEVRHMVGRAGEFGVRAGKVGHDFRRVMARKNELIRGFVEYRQGQLGDGRFELIRAEAFFLDAHTLDLGLGRKVSARNVVLATGSQPSPPPPVPGLAEIGYWTSDDALAVGRLPKSLIVLGGGAVAVEFAQFFARFGTRVTLVQRSAHILSDCDADVAQALEGALTKEGLRLFTGTRLVSARQAGRLKEVTFEHGGRMRRVAAEEILLALGREANTGSLNLDLAGVAAKSGKIVTDASMRTTARHVYAAGDCASLNEIVHLAVLQGELAGHNIAFPRRPRTMDDRLLMAVVFTEPQVATVGLSEKVAAARGVVCMTATYPFNDHGKSLILGATAGFVKLLADPGSGEILGGSCVGPLGGELIHEITAAMAKRMTVGELAAMPHYHPTLAEIWTYPAEELAGKVKSRRRVNRFRRG